MKLRKGLVLFCMMFVAVLLLVACGDNNESAPNDSEGKDTNQQNDANNSNDANGSDDDSGEPTKISIMTKLHTPEVPDDKVLKAIEEAANVELDIEWVPDNNYADKLSVGFSTGTFAQAITVGDNQIDQFKEAIRDDQFWDCLLYTSDAADEG